MELTLEMDPTVMLELQVFDMSLSDSFRESARILCRPATATQVSQWQYYVGGFGLPQYPKLNDPKRIVHGLIWFHAQRIELTKDHTIQNQDALALTEDFLLKYLQDKCGAEINHKTLSHFFNSS